MDQGDPAMSVTVQKTRFHRGAWLVMIFALFSPLRKRIQELIDQRFYRSKYNTEQALLDFAAVARNEVDMERLNAALIQISYEMLQPEEVSLFWRTGPTNRTERHSRTLVPLSTFKNLVGWLLMILGVVTPSTGGMTKYANCAVLTDSLLPCWAWINKQYNQKKSRYG
jgi:hypothetical protein